MQQGARKITQRGSFQVVGKFLSLKNQDAVPWESQNEEAYCYFLEVDPLVCSYRSQPIKISYEFDGAVHTYCPDFRVVRDRSMRPLIVEVKEDRVADTEEFKRWVHVMKSRCHEEDCDFLVVTKSMLFRGSRLANIKFLYSYAAYPTEDQQIQTCLDFLRQKQSVTMGDCFDFLDRHGVSRAVIYHLMYHGKIGFDIDASISADSVLSSLN